MLLAAARMDMNGLGTVMTLWNWRLQILDMGNGTGVSNPRLIYPSGLPIPGRSSLTAGRFAVTVVVAILLVAIGVSIFERAWEFLRFWKWCVSNRVPCALFSLNFHILGLSFSTVSYSTALGLLNLGFDIALAGFALAFLAAVNALTPHGRIS